MSGTALVPTSPLRGGRNGEAVSGGGYSLTPTNPSPVSACGLADLSPWQGRGEGAPDAEAFDRAVAESLRDKARRFYDRASREPDPRIQGAFVTIANDCSAAARALEEGTAA